MSKKKKFPTSLLLAIPPIVIIIVFAIGVIVDIIEDNKMEEISIEDKAVVDLHKKYFRDTDACIEYGVKLFADGTVSSKNMDYDTKEQVAIDYAARKHYDKIGYDELNEVYRLLFNDGTNLTEKTAYYATSGNYTRDGNTYKLESFSKCATSMPDELICPVIKQAYKSKHAIKVIVGLFSGTAEDHMIYSGLNWDAEPLGVYGSFDVSEKDLDKWEIVYHYDDKLGRYLLDYTKKL